MLIQTGRGLGDLADADFGEFADALTASEERLGRDLKHYRTRFTPPAR